MQTTAEQTARRPFHEAIVEAIRRAESLSELGCLGRLIKETKVPKDHDKIITAWNKRGWALGRSSNDFGVSASLLEQKLEAAKEEEKKAKAEAKERARTASSY